MGLTPFSSLLESLPASQSLGRAVLCSTGLFPLVANTPASDTFDVQVHHILPEFLQEIGIILVKSSALLKSISARWSCLRIRVLTGLPVLAHST